MFGASFSHIPVYQYFPFSPLYLMICGAYTDRARAISLAHLNPKHSLKVPCSAPKGDLNAPFALFSFFLQGKAHSDNSKKIPPLILIDQQRDFTFKKNGSYLLSHF